MSWVRTAIACLVLATLVAGCDSGRSLPASPTPPPGPSGPTVRLVYAVPQDRTYRADYAAAVQQAFGDIRSSYRDQMGGTTFTLFRAEPDYCALPRAGEAYLADTWTAVMSDVQGCVPVTYDDPAFRWVIYADVEHGCNAPGRIGAAMRGVTIMGRGDLNGLVGDPVVGDCGNPITMAVGRWVGGAAHELGHTFGLRHPPGCGEGLPECDRNCLMWLGYILYPATYLREEDKATLRQSPFFW